MESARLSAAAEFMLLGAVGWNCETQTGTKAKYIYGLRLREGCGPVVCVDAVLTLTRPSCGGLWMRGTARWPEHNSH
jgi:hypothetical protein